MEPRPSEFKIILGSSSAARRKILAEMGYEFTIMSADIDERSIRKEKPEELVMALAEAKHTKGLAQTLEKPIAGTLQNFEQADALLSKLLTVNNQETDVKPTLLIAADTVVVYEGTIREKPSSKEEALQFIKGYSGGYAETVSSVHVANLSTGFRKGEWDKVEIYFHDIPDQVIDDLIEEGSVLNVAGALIIEHPLILPCVKELVGTTESVMGLPKALTERLLMEAL